jgi:hypothetical protein
MPIFCISAQIVSTQINVNESKLRQRLVILRNLVALGQVRIKIIFPRKNRDCVDAALQSHRRQHREFDRLAVQYRQSTRQSQTHRANICVRRIAKPGRARAKDFRLGQQLYMDFQPNDRLIFREKILGNGWNSRHSREL